MRAPGAALLAGGVLAALAGTWVYLGGADDPGGSSRSGGALAEVIVPEMTGEARLGETEFAENCASCHGANAAGRDGIGPPLVHRVYEPGHHADGAFYLAVARGVRAHHWTFGDMPPVAGVSPEEISRIVAYVRTLQRANGIE
ncbi:c-type cytochrome [Stappia stellulata]|uniref:c-type cytochrome n=1 Tax=Stappia stellulata TaxID=71235 RepID=UPI0003FAA6EC|nr:cytochrome c [Stappia stellulata]